MDEKTLAFTISSEVIALGIKCAVFSINNLTNKRTHPEFEKHKNNLFKEYKEKYSEELLSEDPILSGFEILHQKINCSNPNLIASPQSLITTLLKRDTLPSINLLVDIYNCVSIQSKLSLGAHDIDKIDDQIILRFADGTETFVPLGRNKSEKINTGEYCYIEGKDNVICRMECRQADATKITLGTKNVLFIIQGNQNTTCEYIETIMKQLIDLIKLYCDGGTPKTLWLA